MKSSNNQAIQEIEDIIDKVCLSEVSQDILEGYIDLLGDITQELNDNKIFALIHALEVEIKKQSKSISDIESSLIKYQNKLKAN